MTLLELVQAAWRETGTGGPEPQSVEAQIGEARRLVNWVLLADNQIQSEFVDWNFLWAQDSVTTAASTALYALPSGLSHLDRRTLRIGNELLSFHEYLEFKDDLRISTESKPYQATIRPDRQLELYPTPNDVYMLTFDYWRVPQVMPIVNSSVSIIPEEFHDAILGRAIMMYAEYENAPEILQKGQNIFQPHMNNLIARELPGKRYAHRVAEGNELVIEVE